MHMRMHTHAHTHAHVPRAVGLPRGTDMSRFFFAYVCKKRRLTLPLHRDERVRLPQSWVRGSRAAVAK